MGLGFCIIGIMMIIWKELQSSLIECIVKLMIFVAELFYEYSWSHVTAHRSCYMIMFPYKVINVCNIMNIHDLMPQFTQQVLLIWCTFKNFDLLSIVYASLIFIPHKTKSRIVSLPFFFLRIWPQYTGVGKSTLFNQVLKSMPSRSSDPCIMAAICQLKVAALHMHETKMTATHFWFSVV